MPVASVRIAVAMRMAVLRSSSGTFLVLIPVISLSVGSLGPAHRLYLDQHPMFRRFLLPTAHFTEANECV